MGRLACKVAYSRHCAVVLALWLVEFDADPLARCKGCYAGETDDAAAAVAGHDLYTGPEGKI